MVRLDSIAKLSLTTILFESDMDEIVIIWKGIHLLRLKYEKKLLLNIAGYNAFRKER